MDPHHFGSLDPHSASGSASEANKNPDPHRRDKLDTERPYPDPHLAKPKCMELRAYFS